MLLIFSAIGALNLYVPTYIHCPTRCYIGRLCIQAVGCGDTNGDHSSTPMVVLYRPCKTNTTETRSPFNVPTPETVVTSQVFTSWDRAHMGHWTDDHTGRNQRHKSIKTNALITGPLELFRSIFSPPILSNIPFVGSSLIQLHPQHSSHLKCVHPFLYHHRLIIYCI